MQESLAAEPCSKIFCHALEHLLNRSRISKECDCHFQSFWGDVAHGTFDVVWNPFHEVRRILVLHIQHLFIYFLCGHPPTEQGTSSEVTSMPGVSCAHHILSVKHLLRKFRDCQRAILLRATGSQRSESSHKEMQSGKWNQIYSDFS